MLQNMSSLWVKLLLITFLTRIGKFNYQADGELVSDSDVVSKTFILYLYVFFLSYKYDDILYFFINICVDRISNYFSEGIFA